MSAAMDRNARIYVAGHNGLVGSALVRALIDDGYSNLLLRNKRELDLREQSAVREFFAKEKPEYVFLAAAKVGGILANNDFPAEFIADNLAIQTNVLTAAHANGVRRLLFLGSSCIYPKLCAQPMKEEYLLTGELEFTNRPYAVAKIAGVEMCWAFNRQYGTQFLAIMPTNLFGPADNYDLHGSHVIPALIRRIDDAKNANLPEVVVWGTGKVLREFLYSDDMASACLFLMNFDDVRFGGLTHTMDRPPLLNVGSGEEMTIEELARTICNVVGYTGRLTFDSSKPDGTPRKLLDSTRLLRLGWRPRVTFHEGIRLTYEAYLKSLKKQMSPAAQAG